MVYSSNQLLLLNLAQQMFVRKAHDLYRERKGTGTGVRSRKLLVCQLKRLLAILYAAQNESLSQSQISALILVIRRMGDYDELVYRNFDTTSLPVYPPIGVVVPIDYRIIDFFSAGGFYVIQDTLGPHSTPIIGGDNTNVYAGPQPTNIEVGGIPENTNLQGLTYDKIIEMLTIKYKIPVFTGFSISGQATLIQVGTELSGTNTFVWANTNDINVEPDSLAIRDVTADVLIGEDLGDDNTEDLDIGTISNTVPMSQSWRIEGLNTKGAAFVSSPFAVQSAYPVFYGSFASGGAVAGANRPAADQALIDSGTEALIQSNGTITLNFNSTPDDYPWFAVPVANLVANPVKTIWYITALNTGSIGGAVSPGGNLFPAPVTLSIDSPQQPSPPTPLWAGVSYRIYIANYQSEITGSTEIRN